MYLDRYIATVILESWSKTRQLPAPRTARSYSCPWSPETMNWIVTPESSSTCEISARKASRDPFPSHSSTPSIMSIREGLERGGGRSLKGMMISFCNCVAADLIGRAWSSTIACSICSRILGMFIASWYARVENNWSVFSHPATSRLKKKQAYGCRFSACNYSAIVCMNAVWSTLVRPWIKNTELRGFGSSIQRMIISFSFLRVPGKHLGGGYRAAESWNAPWEMIEFKACMPGIQPLVVWVRI